jgi:hypothetical protein
MPGKQHRPSRRPRTFGHAGTAALALLGAVLSAPAASAAVVDPAPVGPHQYFVGEVNGKSTLSAIEVGCIGPVTAGQTGHPVAGQFIDVMPMQSSATNDVGYTGESADRITVDFGEPVSSSGPIVLSSYAVRLAIPTNLDLPCSGSGEVAFNPAPTSATARPSLVKVTYESIGV